MTSFCGISIFSPHKLSLQNYNKMQLLKLIDYEIFKGKIRYLG